MENKKKKLDDLTKSKLIYSGELLIFGIIFTVLGILILLGTISVRDWKKVAFTWVTLFGGFILYGDFFWVLFSKKRRKKNSLLDKVLVLPSGTFLIGYDLYVLITQDDGIISYVMGGVFIYLAAVYLFEGIYHWFVTHPYLLVDEEKTENTQQNPNKKERGDKHE